MEDTRLQKCVISGELLASAGCVGGQENEWMRCNLDDLRVFFGINMDQWMTAAQDEGEWRKTAEQRAERFMVNWIALQKKTGLDCGMK